MVSSDDFTNADVRYEQSFSNIRASLMRSNGGPQEIPIVTGFLARGENTGMHFSCAALLQQQTRGEVLFPQQEPSQSPRTPGKYCYCYHLFCCLSALSLSVSSHSVTA